MEYEFPKQYRVRSIPIAAMQWRGTNLTSLRAWGAPVIMDGDTGKLSLFDQTGEWVELSLRDYVIKTNSGWAKLNWLTFEETYQEVTDADFDTPEHR
ncbi:hypothetical protein EniyanLRS_67 [Mycobacterium phage EniyanLRS]|nr:hypothetical protein EniyanLRS_67 [Mycobacterium phage EniyanLRS]QGJ89958.1 hypothetical protein PBI_MARYV_70 [Mycobacterium phage MaryV]